MAILLVDVKNSYWSFESYFRPDLWNKPGGVLSNNDGCFIARNDKLKSLNIKMGAPYFKIIDFLEKQDTAVFSSNFPLYCNMSDRLMNILASYSPKLEVYSVDEAFLDLEGLPIKNFAEFGKEIKSQIKKRIGLTVRIGIAPSKTLAKAAQEIAKRGSSLGGVCSLLDKNSQDEALKQIEVEDIWGIGGQQSSKLRALGIKTALQFRDYKNEKNIQKIFTKVGRTTQDELRGIKIIEIESTPAKKKEILVSRSFANPIYDLEGLKKTIAEFTTNGCEKMRSQHSLAQAIGVYLKTSPFRDSEQYHAYEEFLRFSPTQDTRKLIGDAWTVLESIYKAGIEYKKAGIKLTKLVDSDEAQLSIFDKMDQGKAIELMELMDRINKIYGPNMITSMACGTKSQTHRARQEKLSPGYLTRWSDIPRCK